MTPLDVVDGVRASLVSLRIVAVPSALPKTYRPSIYDEIKFVNGGGIPRPLFPFCCSVAVHVSRWRFPARHLFLRNLPLPRFSFATNTSCRFFILPLVWRAPTLVSIILSLSFHINIGGFIIYCHALRVSLRYFEIAIYTKTTFLETTLLWKITRWLKLSSLIFFFFTATRVVRYIFFSIIINLPFSYRFSTILVFIA